VFKKVCKPRQFTPLDFLLKQTMNFVFLIPLARRINFFPFQNYEKVLIQKKTVE
jgi:hypothetical protein